MWTADNQLGCVYACVCVCVLIINYKLEYSPCVCLVWDNFLICILPVQLDSLPTQGYGTRWSLTFAVDVQLVEATWPVHNLFQPPSGECSQTSEPKRI